MKFARRVFILIRGKWRLLGWRCGACPKRYVTTHWGRLHGGFFFLDRHLVRHKITDFINKEHGDIYIQR